MKPSSQFRVVSKIDHILVAIETSRGNSKTTQYFDLSVEEANQLGLQLIEAAERALREQEST